MRGLYILGMVSISVWMTGWFAGCPPMVITSERIVEERGADSVVGVEAVVDAGSEGVAEGTGEEVSGESVSEQVAELPDASASQIPRLEMPTSATPLEGEGILGIQPSLAFAVDGKPGVAFTGPGDDANLSIYFLALDAETAKAAGKPVRLDTLGGTKSEPSMCGLAGGGFVVVWPVDTKDMSDPSGNLKIYFRRVSAAGVPVEAKEVEIRTDRQGNHWLPRVACEAGGGFVVTGVYPDDAMTFGVFVWRFDAEGKPIGDFTPVNTETDGNQVFPAVGGSASQSIVVTWQQDVSGGMGSELSYRPFLGLSMPGRIGPSLEVLDTSSRHTALSVEPSNGDFVVAATGPTQTLALQGISSNGRLRNSLQLPDSGASPSYNPALLALGPPKTHAIAYLKGSGSAVSVAVAILGDAETTQQAVSLATGRFPPYFPSLAYIPGKLMVAWTEREPNTRFTLKLALFR